MKKYITTFLLIIYLFALLPCASALSEVNKQDLTEISALSYDEQRSSEDILIDSSNSERIIIGNGQYATYKVNILKSGYYKLLCYGKHTGKMPDIEVSGDATSPLPGIGVSTNTDQRNTIGRYYFQSGERSFTITVSNGEINFSSLYLKCVEQEIKKDGENIIEAHDYLEANITTTYNEDTQWSYSATGAPYKVQGPVIIGVGTSLRRSTTYRLNVEESGLYRMSVTAKSACDADYSLEIDNEIYSETKMQGDGSGSVCQTATFETFNLSEGAVDITIYCRALSEDDSGGNTYTFYYTLERIGSVKDTGVVKEEETAFLAENIILKDDGIEIYDGIAKISPNAKAFFNLDFDEDTLSALYVTYKAEQETKLKLYFGTDIVFDGLVAPATENVNKQLLFLGNSGEGLMRAYFTADAQIEIESIICRKVVDENLSSAINQVDNAKDESTLEAALKNLKEYGIDTDGMFSGILYKTPIYMRIINDDFKNAEDFINKLKSYIESERVRPWMKFYADGERIYDFKNCEIPDEEEAREGYKIAKTTADIDETNSKGFTKYSTSLGVTTAGEIVWSITPEYSGVYELIFNYGVGGDAGTSLSGVTAFVDDTTAGTYSKTSTGNWQNVSDTVFGRVTMSAGQTYTVKFKNSGVVALLKSLTLNWVDKIPGPSGSGITAVLESSYLKENQTVVLAFYKGNRLYSLDFENYTNQESIPLNCGNIGIKSGEECSFKLFYFNEISGLIPINAFPEIYEKIIVSESGDDENGNGSKEAPFKTLERAFKKVSQINENQWGDIEIHIENGIYKLDETLSLKAEHSGKNGFYVRVCGNEKSKSIISGGEKITDWQENKNGVWYAKLYGYEHVRNLYVNDYPAIRARTDECFVAGEVFKDEGSEWKKDGITIANENMPYSFSKPNELELVWNYVFTSHRTPVIDITDGEGCKKYYLSRDVLNYDSTVFRQGQTFYIENALELLDEPGEFYYSKDDNTIYYYPYEWEDMSSAQCYVGDTELLIDAKGNSLSDKVTNLIFENLSFKYGAYNFASEKGYYGGQADSLTTALTNEKGQKVYAAQFTATKADNIKIKNCEFSCLGSAAIHFDDGVTNSEISGNIIRDISGTGITIGTPLHHIRRTDMEVCRNVNVSNNFLRRTSSEFFNNTAISVYYEKNINVTHNDIDNVPYTGITAGWGWEGSDPYDCGNINISSNRITNVMQSLSDGGGIYTLGTMKNSVISGNFLKGHPAIQGGMIYNDAGSAFIDVFDNVILDAKLSVHIQNVRYRNRHLNYYNNYSDKNTINDYGQSDTISAEDLIILEDGKWPDKAEEISALAGLSDEYKHFIDVDNFGERKLRFDYPIHADEVPIVAVDDSIAQKSNFDVLTEYDGSAALLSAGQYITFNVFAQKEGYHKIIAYGRREGDVNVSLSVDKVGVGGLGFADSKDCRYTIGRYYLAKGDNEIKIKVTKGKAVFKNLYVKNVMHNVSSVGETLIEMHDYYKANVTTFYNEDSQWSYKASNTPFAAMGPIIASKSSPRKVTFKLNVEKAGNYQIKLYSSSGANEVKYSVEMGRTVLASYDAPVSKLSTPLACEEIKFDTVALPEGEIELIISCSPKSGNIFMYYFVMERIV